MNPNIKDWGFGGKYSTPEHDRAAWNKQKGVPKWNKERCIVKLNEILDKMEILLLEQEKIQKNNPQKLKQETVRDLVTMQNRLLEYMKYLYPPVQQNVNLNVNVLTTEWQKALEIVKHLALFKKMKMVLDEEKLAEIMAKNSLKNSGMVNFEELEREFLEEQKKLSNAELNNDTILLIEPQGNPQEQPTEEQNEQQDTQEKV